MKATVLWQNGICKEPYVKWSFHLPTERYSSKKLSGVSDSIFSFAADGTTTNQFAISPDGNLYIMSGDYVYRIDTESGVLHWRYRSSKLIHTESSRTCSPVIGPDGILYLCINKGSEDYFSGDYFIEALNSDGTIEREYEIDGEVRYSPAIDSEGNLYFGTVPHQSWLTGYFRAMKPDGTKKWEYSLEYSSLCSPSIGTDGTIYFATLIGGGGVSLIALDLNGNLKWSSAIESGYSEKIKYSPCLGKNGEIYFGLGNSLYAYDSTGNFLWSIDKRSRKSPIVDNDGTIYFSADDGYLYSIHPDGTRKWRYRFMGTYSSSALVGADGTVYFSADDGNLYALDSQGSLAWKYAIDNISVITAPILDPNGIIYVTDDSKIYAIDTGTNEGLADSPWPQEGHDQQKTKNSNTTINLSIPRTGQDSTPFLINTLASDRFIFSLSADKNGIIYYGTEFGVNAFSFNVGSIWKHEYECIGSSSANIAVGTEGTIYFGFGIDENLYAIDSRDGSFTWKYAAHGRNAVIRHAPAIGCDGTVYFSSAAIDSNYLYALNPDSTLKWEFRSDFPIGSSPVLGPDGTIYFTIRTSDPWGASCAEPGYVFALNQDGIYKWHFETECAVSQSLAVDNQGTIYFGSDDKHLYAVKSDGSLKWKFETNDLIKSAPVIGPDKTIYFGSYDGFLYALHHENGNLKWKFETGDWIRYSPAIAADGKIYFSSFDNYFYVLNPEGELHRKYFLSRRVSRAPLISEDGKVYITSHPAIQVFDSGIGSLASDSPWPQFAHDARNTNSLQKFTISVLSIKFDSLKSGHSATDTLLIRNWSDTDLTTDIMGLDNNIFSIANSIPSISPGDSQNVIVFFKPQSAGLFADTLLIATQYGTVSVKIGGIGKPPIFKSSTGNIIFKETTSNFELWVILSSDITPVAVTIVFSNDRGQSFENPISCNKDGELFKGQLPAQQAGITIHYYFEVIDDEGSKYCMPEGAPEQLFSLKVAYSGDVDNNGKTDIFDLLELLKHLSGSKPQSNQSDVNKDGKVDIFDLLSLLQSLSAQ